MSLDNLFVSLKLAVLNQEKKNKWYDFGKLTNVTAKSAYCKQKKKKQQQQQKVLENQTDSF